MRSDLAQLLVERPRTNRGETYKVQRRQANQTDPEDGFGKEGMRRFYRERKQFNEYFAPLLGFLESSVGRKWDDVYSDIMKSMRGGGTVIEHVRGHLLRDFVIVKPEWNEAGKPCYPASLFHRLYVELEGSYSNKFYVDRSGVLRMARRKRRQRLKPMKPPFERVPCDNESSFYKLNGIWYRVWTEPLPEAGPEVTVYDWMLGQSFKCYRPMYPVTHHHWYWWQIDGLIQAHGGRRVPTARRQQVSSREIRKYKLNKAA